MNFIKQAKQALGALPKVKLGFYPTPLYKLQQLSEKLGVELYLKREDLSGFSPFGGNKIRKLEYILGDAIAKGCDHIITFGALQSNHAMQTVASCRKYGLVPILYLHDEYGFLNKQKPCGNFLINSIMGADIHVLASKEQALAEAQKQINRLGKHSCYCIPGGGASVIGTAGFTDAFLEIHEQAIKENIHVDYVYHASGSGGTLSGLLAGKTICDSSVQLVSVIVGEKDQTYPEGIVQKTSEFMEQIGLPVKASVRDVQIERGFYLPGYDRPNEEASAAIRLLAQSEGILLDPVYTGKAFSALLQHINDGTIKQKSTVVFIHTGGTLALFSGENIVGPWFDGHLQGRGWHVE